MMNARRRALCLLTCLLLCAVLTGCGKKQAAPAPTPAPTAEPVPETPAPTPVPTPTPVPEIRILGETYQPTASSVELRGLQDAQAAETAAALRRMPALQLIHIGSETETPLSWESLKLLHDAAPGALIDYAFTLFDRPFV